MLLKPLTKVSGISPATFKKEYSAPKIPVLLGDFFDHEVLSKWNYDYFKERAGDSIVKVFGNEGKFNNHVASAPVSTMKFSEYLDLISSQPTDLRLFLFNLLQKVPELKKEISINDPTGGKVMQWLPFLFFGGEGSSVRNHFDIDMSHVFLSQLKGIKRVLVFAPDQSKCLYRLPFNFHTIASLGNPDFEKFPGLKYAHGYEAILHPGETLFIPAGFWHYIQYVTEGYSVSYRAVSQSYVDRVKGVRNLILTRYFDNAMRVMLDENWLSYKSNRAYRNASLEIKKLALQEKKEYVNEEVYSEVRHD